MAAALALASTGDLDGGLAGLQALAKSDDADLQARVGREIARLEGLRSWRDAWLKDLQSSNKNLRVLVEGKMAAFKIEKIDGGDVIFTKARKGVDRVALKDLSPSLLLENLGKGLRDLEPTWLQGYLPGLAQAEWDPAALEGVEAQTLEEMGQYPWMLHLGSLLGEIQALAKVGYPEGREALVATLDRVGAVNKAQATIPALQGMGSDLKSYAADLATKAYEQAGLPDLLKGAATDLGEGRWKFVYEFDKPEELMDFVSDPTLFDNCMPAPDKPFSPDASGFVHNESALAWAGRVGVLHHVPLTGAMTARYEWKLSRIGETFDIQGGNLIFGLAADPEGLSFIGQAFLHSVWCYQKGQLANNSNGPIPMYENRLYKCVVDRDAEGTVTGSVDGKETGKVSIPKVDLGPFFLAANLNIRGRIERLELEGTVDMLGLEFLRKQRAYEHLVSLGLEGLPPKREARD